MSKNKVRRIFISATGQNDGKTVVSLGLICALKERFKKVGFIKPVGQRYVTIDGEMIDEDSVLIENICGIGSPIKDMSPIAIERGFTARYIERPNKKRLTNQIKKSFGIVSKNRDMVVIEGTGHAGVGSVFDLSNATVAKMLRSKAIIVSSGGVGRPIDEITLNAALFEKAGVEIAGVIVNKVRADKYDKVNRLVRKGLKRKGLPVLGVIPYKEMLAKPSIGQLAKELGFTMLCRSGDIDVPIGNIIVGAMSPHEAVRYFSHRCLIITPGDREDLISAIAGYKMDRAKEGIKIGGVVLSGGIKPHKTAVDLLCKVNIPMLLARGDTYSVASKVHDLTVKVRPEDKDKSLTIKNMIERYVDIDCLSKNIL